MTRSWNPLLIGSIFLFVTALLAGDVFAQPATAADLPDASPAHLPRWRGFNLLEKFHVEWNNHPFVEADFQIIHELGFNFVRLPMDYRIWIKDGDWNAFDEEQLRQIDQAVQWGKQYSIHVCINFHRAPGYTVASPPEATSLWTDAETQQVCAKHWAAFARRYKGIPNRQLSFNLFNEPSHVDTDRYIAVVTKIAAAIRAEDSERLIISDGLDWGRTPIAELIPLKVAQATRGYTPMNITHYKASWVEGAEQYPTPVWPRMKANGILYAAGKSDLPADVRKPLVISGTFGVATKLRLRVHTVSAKAKLIATADGKEFWNRDFLPGGGKGEWKESHFIEQWHVYRNVYDHDYETTIPAGTKRVELSVPEGDWLSLSEIAIQLPGQPESMISLQGDWGQAPAQVMFDASQAPGRFVSQQMEDRKWLWDDSIARWQQISRNGCGVMVGEFGCYNQTPHNVALAWMEDCLQNWTQADMGWALWNFRGSFGILDSARDDIQYESFHGHQLDRKMLTLLQRY